MAEQQPPPETSRETSPATSPETTAAPTRLRDRPWSFATAVSACVAALLVGGVLGASLGAMAAGGGDDQRMVRHPGMQRDAQPWPGWRSDGPRRERQDVPPGPSQERLREMQERWQQWREQLGQRELQRPGQNATPPDTPEPSPAPLPEASEG